MASRAAILFLAAAALGLGACAETQLVIHTAKKIVPGGGSDAPAKTEGHYKIGKPYPVQGIWYYPAVDYDYVETGIASWYGPQFHGKRTANGETFDMNEISAAHRTLPLPSVVRVTNLRNGRSIQVRINDRGPFARNRIIDMSRRGAQLLGFERDGTTPVRVEILADESRRLAAIAQGKTAPQVAAAPSAPVKVVTLDGPNQPRATPPAAPRREIEQVPSGPTVVSVQPVSGMKGIFVQAGSFIDRARAESMKRKLAGVGSAHVAPAQIGNQRFYRVRVGPVRTVEAGDALLDQVIAYGYPDARIVVDD